MRFEIHDRTCRLRRVTRTGRELAAAHAAQFPAQGLPGDLDLEFRQYLLAKTCDPPAHHSVKVRCRSLFDHLRQCQAGRVIKDRHRPDPASLRALRLIRPTGPKALNRSTGSRTIGGAPDRVVARKIGSDRRWSVSRGGSPAAGAGLSDRAEGFQEVLIVPGAFSDTACEGGDVGRGVVFAAAAVVFVAADFEDPVQGVFDAPLGSIGLQWARTASRAVLGGNSREAGYKRPVGSVLLRLGDDPDEGGAVCDLFPSQECTSCFKPAG